MSVSNVPQNQVPNEPSLADLFNLWKKNIFLAFNCHAIGTVQEFDGETQTCTATINYKKTFFEPDTDGTYNPVLKDYPVLVDCPVIVPGGGNGCLTFPVTKGDECLVLFNDRDLDNWFQGGSGGSVATPRLHSFSDGMVLVGLRSMANVIPSYNATSTELRTKDGTVKISVDATGGVTVTTPITTTVFAPSGTVTISNETGSFQFKANADIAFDTGTVQGLFGNGGKVKFTNAVGELIGALNTILTTATAGGFPLIIDPTSAATLASFVG